MNALTYIPEPPLSAFVELFWYCDSYPQHHTRERILPTGDVQLIISLRDDLLRTYDSDDVAKSEVYRGPLVAGPHSRCSIIDTSPMSSCMGVQFKTGGAYPFFQTPVGEFHNLNLTLDALWGRVADELRDRLLEARSPIDRFRILEEILLSQLHPERERHPAVDYALRKFQGGLRDQTITEVIQHTGISQKWFIEIFRAQVGLTPLVYCRLQRFQQALTLIGGKSHVDWASVALSSGYYDQAHFNRDFRAFSGLCPTRYLADRGEHQNHVRLPD